MAATVSTSPTTTTQARALTSTSGARTAETSLETAATTPRRSLKLGSTGDGVADLQRLIGLEPTGVFDAATDKAVRAFQASHGLEVDGKAGMLTIPAMRRAAVSERAPPLPPSSSSTKVGDPPMPADTGADPGAIYGVDPSPTTSARGRAARVIERAEQDIGRVQPGGKGYKGWDYLQGVFEKTTGWRPADKDIRSDSTPKDKHWCGVWAVHMYQEAGVDVKWDLNKGRPVGDIAYTSRPAGKQALEDFRASVKPGDIVTIDGKYNHHALVVGVNADGSIETIDGNKPHIGRDHYAISKVNGFYRPKSEA